ncbi:uncharacterized protein UHO2_00830 [Ustilago hordei]|uniref:uncharacterized protein n=1 Tax=Ustilago hordei TaxID=120017 RepID=UPI001A4C76D0|nr:uncharacterized protein UHO2_00830 [Ustilago hordei]SYW73965.1 uncharacterized protein UHO2_00830 [Ustilago hordei]
MSPNSNTTPFLTLWAFDYTETCNETWWAPSYTSKVVMWKFSAQSDDSKVPQLMYQSQRGAAQKNSSPVMFASWTTILSSIPPLSEVACPKPDICNRTMSIMNPVEICNNACGIMILAEICSRDVSITFLT